MILCGTVLKRGLVDKPLKINDYGVPLTGFFVRGHFKLHTGSHHLLNLPVNDCRVKGKFFFLQTQLRVIFGDNLRTYLHFSLIGKGLPFLNTAGFYNLRLRNRFNFMFNHRFIKTVVHQRVDRVLLNTWPIVLFQHLPGNLSRTEALDAG